MSEFRHVYRTELSPVSFLTRSAYVYPDKVAVVHGARRYTYRQLEERVNRLASALRAAGLQKRDRVAFLCPNIPPMLEAHFGVPAAGGVLVAINTRLSRTRSATSSTTPARSFSSSTPSSSRSSKPLDAGRSARRARWTTPARAGDPYEDFLAGGAPGPVESWLEDEEETIAINYTSGTTGRPKGVMYTHRGAYLNASARCIEPGWRSTRVYLWTLPMFHCNGWCFPWAVTAVGGTHVCLRRVDRGAVWDLIDKEGVTHFNGAPTVLIGSSTTRRRTTLDAAGDRLRRAARRPRRRLLGAAARRSAPAVHVYGLTETYGPHTVCDWHEEWDALPADEQCAPGRAAGPGLPDRRPRARRRRRDARRAARRPRRWARSSCAATT